VSKYTKQRSEYSVNNMSAFGGRPLAEESDKGVRATIVLQNIDKDALARLEMTLAEKTEVNYELDELRGDLTDFHQVAREKALAALSHPLDAEAADEAKKAASFESSIKSDIKLLKKGRLRQLEIAEIANRETFEQRDIRRRLRVDFVNDSAMVAKQEVAIDRIFAKADLEKAKLARMYYEGGHLLKLPVQFVAVTGAEHEACDLYNEWAMQEATADVALVLSQATKDSLALVDDDCIRVATPLITMWRSRIERDKLVCGEYDDQLAKIDFSTPLQRRVRLRFEQYRAHRIYKADMKAGKHLLTALTDDC
jgi:hypothetical protein